MQATKNGTEYNPVGNVNVAPTAVSLEASFEALINDVKTGAVTGKDLKIELDNVLYSVGKAELKAESYGTLNSLVSLLTANPSVKIEISGHTDNTGDATENLQLSEGRAHAVYDYLVGHGIATERLAYKGYGDTEPLVSNDTEEGLKQNRRTELKIVQ